MSAAVSFQCNNYFDQWGPWVLGSWEEELFIFRELGSTDNYVRSAEEQTQSFEDLRNLPKVIKFHFKRKGLTS